MDKAGDQLAEELRLLERVLSAERHVDVQAAFAGCLADGFGTGLVQNAVNGLGHFHDLGEGNVLRDKRKLAWSPSRDHASFVASSPESVGEFRLRQGAKAVI
jgi:hypothetical protein